MYYQNFLNLKKKRLILFGNIFCSRKFMSKWSIGKKSRGLKLSNSEVKKIREKLGLVWSKKFNLITVVNHRRNNPKTLHNNVTSWKTLILNYTMKIYIKKCLKKGDDCIINYLIWKNISRIRRWMMKNTRKNFILFTILFFFSL